MKKTALIVIAIALLISACKSEIINTDDFVVTPIPTLQPLSNQPEVTDDLTNILRKEMEWGLEIEPYVATELDNGELDEILNLYLLSSGIFDRTTITLKSGETLEVDIVYAYQLTHARSVLVIPIAVGVETEDGRYTYFAENYILTAAINKATNIDPEVLSRVTRSEALKDAGTRLLAGRVFVLFNSHPADRNSIDWVNCPNDYYVGMTGEYCQAGLETDRGYTNLIVQRAATSLPDGWLLIGWFFSELSEICIIDF